MLCPALWRRHDQLIREQPHAEICFEGACAIVAPATDAELDRHPGDATVRCLGCAKDASSLKEVAWSPVPQQTVDLFQAPEPLSSSASAKCQRGAGGTLNFLRIVRATAVGSAQAHISARYYQADSKLQSNVHLRTVSLRSSFDDHCAFATTLGLAHCEAGVQRSGGRCGVGCCPGSLFLRPLLVGSGKDGYHFFH